MAQSGSPGEDAKEQIEKVARKASPWIDRLARMGYVTKGVVYVVIGSLALREALGFGGETTGPSSAFRSIGSQPFGSIMVALLAGGLACYALWKLVQGIMDPDEKGSDAHGILRRVGYVGSGVIHCCLAFIAAQSILGAEDSSEDAMTASAMAYQPPLGQLLVGVVGLVVIGVGLYQLYAAYEAKFLPELKLERVGEAGTRWITYAGRVGTTARALAIGVAGAFLLLAAYQSDPSETRGLGEALETLQRQPLGSYMLATIAAGLIVYGVFMFAVARYRHIDPA
ncbi:MAG: DUF1206 domain-containing protein [Actinomycetota bacterium]|nr:DUF1206 domain-containing protein [Actinomycetota bacterium]MDQ5817156.1 DUF1206 domain-containing protein [Actinomycetota bacterium]